MKLILLSDLSENYLNTYHMCLNFLFYGKLGGKCPKINGGVRHNVTAQIMC